MATIKIIKIQRYHSGQSLILALALILISSMMLFFIFNSGRAVNQKINLVNAADAAAYSGAQITARQLNFMAYTNRAMVANEVSIGHMFSYQLELDLVSDVGQSIANNGGGFLGQLANLLVNLFMPPNLQNLVSNTFRTFGQLFAAIPQLTEGVVGIYALTIDANNAFYSTLQQEAFRDFAYPDEGSPLVVAAMQAVVDDYETGATVSIRLNDRNVLDHFAVNGVSEDIRRISVEAGNMHADFCKMVLFVSPGQATNEGSVGSGNEVAAFCDALASGGGGSGGGAGTAAQPLQDAGSMVGLLQSTVANMENATWIRDRDLNYRLPLLLFAQVQRSGTTTVDYDASSGQINWSAANESLRIGDPLLNLRVAGKTINADIASMSAQASSILSSGLITMFQQAGLCGANTTVQCASLANGQYRGVQRYTYLNPDFVSPRITAFLSQPNCSDGIGVDEDGNEIDGGWHNNLRYLDEDDICDDTAYAVAQAEVFFQRPACVGGASACEYGFASVGYTERPNLFNPFWQARLR